jgi:ribonucleotide reductase alpha subunit
LFKDAANAKSNQQNLGTIKSSNLCTEIIEFSSPEESAVCNLASIALSKCVENKEFNYEKLHMISKIVTVNLNRIIDKNYYPTKEAKRSNLLHRPIGIGVQGLADTFALMDIAFDSDLAKETNTYIFETIYHGALEASCELAMERKEVLMPIRAALDNDVLGFNDYDNPIDMVTGEWERLAEYMPLQAEMNNLEEKYLGAYSSFTNSPMYNGYFQFDLWKVAPSDRYDWKLLMKNIQENGIRNSLLLAPMPTASTSQILGNNECFEPFTNNIYSRRTLAGDFIVVNKYLMKELIDTGLWNKELKDNIIENRGSIQHITNISDHIKAKYKTAWELSMKTLINMAADRGAYICQSQSMNLWVEDPDYAKLTAMHFYSWEKGLKTGIYYLRRKPKHNAQQFTIIPKEEDSCEMCGS